MKIALLTCDGGDGSQNIEFYRDPMLAQAVAEDERYCEEYYGNEGSATIIEVQDDFEPPYGWGDNQFIGKFEL